MDPDPAVFVLDLQDANKKLDFSVPKRLSGQTFFGTVTSWFHEISASLHDRELTKEPEISVPLDAVLRIRDVYSGSRILIFTHPGSWIPDPGSRIPDPGSRIPDPGSKNSKKREG
jgi:hypothetical protein